MTGVLTSLGMISVLLLTFTVSTAFASTSYAAADFPTSALGTQIRELINNQIKAPSVQITMGDLHNFFPGQNGDSVTTVHSMCSELTGDCFGSKNILIPGIGEGKADVLFTKRVNVYVYTITFSGFPGQIGTSTIRPSDLGHVDQFSGIRVAYFPLDLRGIGTGTVRIVSTVPFNLPF